MTIKNTRRSASNNRSGSILIMMTLIMVMAAMYLTTALFDVRGTVDQERLFRTKKQMTYLRNAIVDYRLNNPTLALANLGVLVSNPGTVPTCGFTATITTYTDMRDPIGYCGPYLDTSLFLGSTTAYQEDAWGNTLLLSVSGASPSYRYRIQSYGENLSNNSCTTGTDDVCEDID